MNKFILTLATAVTLAFGGETSDVKGEVDCLIIEEENSIVCKYLGQRKMEDRFIDVEWLDPKGNVSRTKKIVMPSGHGSVYDYRYKRGRALGVWTFRAIDGEQSYETEFILKK